MIYEDQMNQIFVWIKLQLKCLIGNQIIRLFDQNIMRTKHLQCINWCLDRHYFLLYWNIPFINNYN